MSLGIRERELTLLIKFLKGLVPQLSEEIFAAQVEFQSSLRKASSKNSELRKAMTAYHPRVTLDRKMGEYSYRAVMDDQGRVMIERYEAIEVVSDHDADVHHIFTSWVLGELMFDKTDPARSTVK